MSLVFRTDQTTPLTNDQVDNNFKYLRDQINLKYSTSDFTSANISLKLRTVGPGQSSYDLAQLNAINAWTVRDLEPTTFIPTEGTKDSIVARDSNGDIFAGTLHGDVIGNATSSTVAATAGKLTDPVKINGVDFDGHQDITVADSTKLPLSGGTMTGKLNLINVAYLYAPLNLGIAAPDDNSKTNGDVWATSDSIRYHLSGTTHTIAPIESPTLTGIPRAPGPAGTPDQIITLSHLSNAVATINTTLATKASISSPTFTGYPNAPTAAATVNNEQIATTRYVTTAVTTKASELIISSNTYTDQKIVAYGNTVNTALALKADLASPNLTGTPTAPTATPGTSNSQIANTAFTAAALAAMQANVNASISALNDLIASTRPVPVAAVFYIASSEVPYGYFEANGQAVSQSTYHDLWVKLGSPATTAGDAAGTFRIPDLRGEFVRGWDHGRGIDNGRLIKSAQGEHIGSHTHDFYDVYAVSADAAGNYNLVNGVPTYPGGTSPANYSGLKDVDGNFVYQYYYMQNGVDGDYDGGAYAFKNRTIASQDYSELRPRNVALMPIIKW